MTGRTEEVLRTDEEEREGEEEVLGMTLRFHEQVCGAREVVSLCLFVGVGRSISDLHRLASKKEMISEDKKTKVEISEAFGKQGGGDLWVGEGGFLACVLSSWRLSVVPDAQLRELAIDTEGRFAASLRAWACMEGFLRRTLLDLYPL